MTYHDRPRVLVVGPATFMDSPAARSLRRHRLDIIHAESITLDLLLGDPSPEIAIVYSDRPDAGMSVAISELRCWNQGIPVIVVTRELPPEWPSLSSQVDLNLELARTELMPLVRLLVLSSRSQLPKATEAVQLGSGYGLVEPGAHIAYFSSDPEDQHFPTRFLATTPPHERALVFGSALQNREVHAKVNLYRTGASRLRSGRRTSSITANHLDLTMLTVLLERIIAARRAGSRNLRILSTVGCRSVDRIPDRVRVAERLWTRVCAQIPAVLVCCFRVGSPQALDYAIKTHPYIITGGKLIRNPLCTF